MPRIPKTYEYKIYRGTTYLGLLPYVTSEFSYSQSINSSGSQLTITVGESPDTARYAVQALTDEGGNEITTEAGETITTEREDDLVGSGSDNALIQNDNLVKVYEVSENHLNGLLVFSGYISKWRALFGGADSVEITVLSDGQDLNQWIIPGGLAYGDDQTQTSTNSDFGFWYDRRYGQSFTTAATTTNIGKIDLKLARNSAANRNMRVRLWNNPAEATTGGTPLASADVLVTSVNPAYVQTSFVFTDPVTVTPSTSYFFSLEILDVASVSGDSTTWGAFQSQSPANYTGGSMYRSISGASWTLESAESMWFKTYKVEDTTERTYLDRDPSYILNDIMDNYSGVVIPYATFPDTSITIPSYTFKLNTVLEGLRAIGDMAPSDWYWFVDPSDNTLYFQQASAEADITVIKGRHINYLSIEGTKETVVTKAYFSGGDDGTGDNVFVVVTDDTSNNRLGITRLSDNNVNGTDGNSTATILAQNYIDRNNIEIYRTSVTINDSTMDTNLFKLGMMIGFTGFGTFVDRLILQVVGIDKRPDNVTLQLGSLQPRASQIVESIQYSITSVQTSNNPNIPS
jgi:hypothetical protein